MNDTRASGTHALARLLDSAIQLPGTRIRVGLDAIVGLIPGAGDVLAAALGSIIVMTAVRQGAPAPIITRMLGNIALDTTLGSVPLIGDLFDVAFRSNRRNAELLDRYVQSPATTITRSRVAIAITAVAVIAVLVAVVTLGILLARLIWRLVSTIL